MKAMSFTFFALLLATNIASAQTFTGTFVMTRGDVKILRAPHQKAKGPFLIYEGKKYSYEKARIGAKVLPAQLVHTGTNGRAKIVYPNGDHFNLGPGSAMSLPSTNKGEGNTKNGSKLNLFYGKVRSLISKGGPRTNMSVKTPSATAGVRGTDFFLRHNPTEGSQLSVLRGEVSLRKVIATGETKTVSVKKGFTAKVEAPEANVPEEKPIEVELSTKEEIVEIHKETALKPDEKAIEKLPEEVKNEISKLSTKSAEAVVQDIKNDDPDLYEEIKDQINPGNVDSAYDINTKVVSRLYNKAPGEVKKKPTSDELDAIGRDVYDKYFRSQ